MTAELDFFATTAKGTEALLASELEGLGARAVKARRAGVSFRGSLEAGYRACLWCRTASRVLLKLGSFEAPTPEGLYEGVRAIPWQEHIAAMGTLAVNGHTTDSSMTHSQFVALKTKDAIVDRLRDLGGSRPSVDRERPDVRVNLRIFRDRATVSIDLSGDSLHRRGYRQATGPAPLKETLAAAVLMLAGWPELAKEGDTFLDPMCGAGTLPIEAALLAADRAPGLSRQRFGFSRWLGHERALWASLEREAKERAEQGALQTARVFGCDSHPGAVGQAQAALERLGLAAQVRIEHRELRDSNAPQGASDRGLIATNPPYGVRLGDARQAAAAHQELGRLIAERLPHWKAAVLTGVDGPVQSLGLRASEEHSLFNGALPCRLLVFEPTTQASDDRASDDGVLAFENRLRKNHRRLRKWAKKAGVECYRLYDADLPDYALAVDLYGTRAQVQEYEPPKSVNQRRARTRRTAALKVVAKVLGIDTGEVILKVRRRQRGHEQYDKLQDSGAFFQVREGGHCFTVNLTDYLDTGLFLDHRPTRALVAELAKGKRFLNLFCYTGTATVYAAAAGATDTTSVDLSKTYLDWLQQNLAQNSLSSGRHRVIRADCLQWLESHRERYGLIFLDPPTFSNSKRMGSSFDVQRDHGWLLDRAAELLDADGVLLFSNNARRFKLDKEALSHLQVEEITARTIPEDFRRNRRIHNVWLIRRPLPANDAGNGKDCSARGTRAEGAGDS